MQPNVIYLSDASFDADTGCAGIGIKNLFSGESHSLCVKAKNINEAEEFALIEAINHALCSGHRNCVFVYDNLNIDTDTLKGFYAGMFEKLQFMWFKREYLGVVDCLAAMAKPRKKGSCPRVELLLSMIPQMGEDELIAMFMPYARAEVYGFLCSLSAAAPMYRALPKGYPSANTVLLSILWQFGTPDLRRSLEERFGKRQMRKHSWYEAFLEAVQFGELWAEDARRECRGLKSS